MVESDYVDSTVDRKDEDLTFLIFVNHKKRENVYKSHIKISPLACTDCKWERLFSKYLLFHLFKQSGEVVELARVNFQIE